MKQDPDRVWEAAAASCADTNQATATAWQLLEPIARKLASPKARRRFEERFLRDLAAYLVSQLEERNRRLTIKGTPIDLGKLPQFAFVKGGRKKPPSLSWLILGQACLLLHKRGAKELKAAIENDASASLFQAGSYPKENP